MSYNGWANRQTWNVALWLQNTESYYRAIVEFMANYKGDNPYLEFIADCGLDTQHTGDGIAFKSETLNYEELNKMMLEHLPEGAR